MLGVPGGPGGPPKHAFTPPRKRRSHWKRPDNAQRAKRTLDLEAEGGQSVQHYKKEFFTKQIGLRGRGPVQDLLRRLRQNARVVMVDESRTSVRCSSDNCGCQLSRFRLHDRDAEGNRVERFPWPLKECLECFKIWNRDTNAARNMLACTLAAAQGQARPAALQRDVVAADALQDEALLDLQAAVADE